MGSSAGFIMLVAVLPLVATGIAWHFHRSRGLLERWAERNGHRIIAAQYRHVFRGPFFWTSSKGQTVYRVTVEVMGGVRTGWVRCGSWWLGLLSDQVEVRWDEEPAVAAKQNEAPARSISPMHDQWIDG